jgi:hypothetical protein
MIILQHWLDCLLFGWLLCVWSVPSEENAGDIIYRQNSVFNDLVYKRLKGDDKFTNEIPGWHPFDIAGPKSVLKNAFDVLHLIGKLETSFSSGAITRGISFCDSDEAPPSAAVCKAILNQLHDAYSRVSRLRSKQMAATKPNKSATKKHSADDPNTNLGPPPTELESDSDNDSDGRELLPEASSSSKKAKTQHPTDARLKLMHDKRSPSRMHWRRKKLKLHLLNAKKLTSFAAGKRSQHHVTAVSKPQSGPFKFVIQFSGTTSICIGSYSIS